MVNVIWFLLLMAGLVTAGALGNMDGANKAIFEGAKQGVTISIGFISILSFWLGMMKIAEYSGLLSFISKLLHPLVRWLFPQVPKGHPAFGYIISNITANLFGLGNAATPMGIKAIQELQKLNPDPQMATPSMITLLALNTSSITLIPITVIVIRLNYGSVNAVEIVGTTLFATFISTTVAIFLDRWFRNNHLK
ncbi:spore maturation protein [Microaerobacter geothermalis]|uniref:nucleoside recognition domain-containing protein n=1 Tax=Microaerobacter geothermalis TaxID=674972 RepID=UPI001F1CDF3B|nr:nucleoside recognition domain-containing protein [Microaerobacter geothermalis]MCF6093488.1 spore maturation protein [Microaerobacter geothermalis]